MQLIGALLWLAFLVGVPLSLFAFIRRDRRRKRHAFERARAEETPATSRVIVTANRAALIGCALVFAIFAGDGIAALASGKDGVGVIVILVCAPAAALMVRVARARRPVLVIDRDGLSVVSAGKAVRWSSVTRISVEERAGVFGTSRHFLSCAFHPGASDLSDGRGADAQSAVDSVDVSLDMLSMRWTEIVVAIEARLGRSLDSVADAAT